MRRLSFLAAFIIAAFVVSVTAWAQYIGGGSITGGGGGGLTFGALLDQDGPASQLDADFLDGISSSGFAQTFTMTTGLTCAAGGGASTLALDIVCPEDGGIVIVPIVNSDADGCVVTVAETSALPSCSAVLLLSSSAGGTVTVADVSNILEVDGSWLPTVGDVLLLTYADLSNDRWQELARTTTNSAITATGLTTTGDITLNADGNDFNLANISSGIVAMLTLVSSVLQIKSAVTDGSILQLGGSGATSHLGTQDNRAASAFVACMTDDLNGSGGLGLCSYGAGLMSTLQPQTCDCGTAGTPNTVTCDIQSRVVYLVDGDADACTVTLSETTASAINADLDPIRIVVTNLGGGGSFTIADSAGVIDLAGGASFTGDSLGDTLTVHYVVGGSTDAFYEVGRANN